MKMVNKEMTWIPVLYMLTTIIFVIHTYKVIIPDHSIRQSSISGETFGQNKSKSQSLIDATPSLSIRLDKLTMNIIDKATRSVNQKPQPYRALVTILIVLGGDIETNPGPIKYPWKICNKPVARTHRALQ